MSELVWTKDKPTVPGLWPWRDGPGCAAQARRVRRMSGGLELGVEHCGGLLNVNCDYGEWGSHPYPEPAEPPKPLPLPKGGRVRINGEDGVIVDWGEGTTGGARIQARTETSAYEADCLADLEFEWVDFTYGE